jgi:hypothetical protein
MGNGSFKGIFIADFDFDNSKGINSSLKTLNI